MCTDGRRYLTGGALGWAGILARLKIFSETANFKDCVASLASFLDHRTGRS